MGGGASATNCSECRSAGSVENGYCQVCFFAGPTAPLRFSDVIAELRAISGLAATPAGPAGADVASACRRAESLLSMLRHQFVQEVILAPPAPSAAAVPLAG